MARPRLLVLSVGLTLVAFLGVRGDAQQPAPDQQTPIFRTGINVVRVDVIVSDRNGQMLSDLKPADFEVTEDGKPQMVDQFRLIKLDGGVAPTSDGPPPPIRTDEDEEREAGRADVRLFAVFLDDYHVRQGSSISVRTPLTKFIESQLGPSDMVGLMYPLQPLSSIRMTRNHQAVIGGIQQFEGRKYDYRPKNEAEQQLAFYPAETVETIRNQISLSALEGLIIHMGSLKEGRKALILVSEGYSDILPPQLRDAASAIPGSGNPNTNDAQAGVNDPNEARTQFFAASNMNQRLREVYNTANKYNVAIYAVDPRGLPTSEFDLSQPAISNQTDRLYLNATMDTLRVLSEQTDGRAIVNRNDLDVGMKQIVRDSSAYYLLGYNSSQTPSDGKFHEIKVRVKRAGVQVRARKGYWALTTDDVKAASKPREETPKAFTNALATISQQASAHSLIRTWVGTSRGENGKTKVTFTWEPAPRAAADRDPARAEAPARVMLTAVGPDGSPYFRGRVSDRVTFDVSPGKMQLRMSVEGAASQVLDTDAREVVVPDLTAPKPTLGTPEVYRARLARDYQQLKANADAIPTAAREFSRTDRLLVRVPAYAGGTAVPVLSAHLLNRDGKPMSELQVADSIVPGVRQIEVPIAGIPPGEYILEVRAAADGDSSGSSELVAFRVTN
jgi:VWFA-related protein